MAVVASLVFGYEGKLATFGGKDVVPLKLG